MDATEAEAAEVLSVKGSLGKEGGRERGATMECKPKVAMRGGERKIGACVGEYKDKLAPRRGGGLGRIDREAKRSKEGMGSSKGCLKARGNETDKTISSAKSKRRT